MRVIQLLAFTANETDFYFTNAGASYSFEGKTYISGVWGGIDSFEQRNKPAINEHTVTLDDADLSLTNSIYSGKWQWQKLSVRWLVLNESGNVEDSFLVFQGAIVQVESSEDTQRSEVILRVQENHLLEQVHGHRTNTASQHLVDADDDCFELLPYLDGLTLPWGKASSTTGPAGNIPNDSELAHYNLD